MDINEAIFGRHTVRRFSNKSISDEIIKKIITAGTYAPSACNLQNWRFIVVKEGDRKLYYNEILENAPVIIFVIYRSDVNNVTGYKHKDYVQSAAAAIQNMLLMAYSEGVGTCWVCDLPDNSVLQEHFNVPHNFEVLAAIAIGYPLDKINFDSHKLFHSDTVKNYENRKRKKSLEEIVFYEKYGNISKCSEATQSTTSIYSDNCIKDYWIKCLLRITLPVLENCASGMLRSKMPLNAVDEHRAKKYAHLEALGRTVLGVSAWVEKIENDTKEETKKEVIRQLVRKSIENSVNIESNDYLNWDEGDQPLVDAAFLALGILQSKTQIWEKLSHETQKKLLIELKKTRRIAPWRSNWILFSAMIEVFVYVMEGEEYCVKSVIDYAMTQFEQWYIGDGFYKDGDSFHYDYYESIVIHPFILEIVKWIPWYNEEKYIDRSLRYSKLLINMIGKDGTYPLVGRSICYRGGVFHLLAKIAYEGYCNKKNKSCISVSYDEIRTSLMAVLNKYMSCDIFDEEGWLKVGIVGEQTELAEEYINTGSLYMIASMFLVLGCENEFWQGEKTYGLTHTIWNGGKAQRDCSLEGWIS